MNTPPNFKRYTFDSEKQQVDDDLDYEDGVTNRLHDIGIGVLTEPYQSWEEANDSVAFCLTQNNNDAQQGTHDNEQTICARMDGWSHKTDIDKDDGKFATDEWIQEFRGQPGTVIVKDGNHMIITRNIDNLPGQSGAPLMLVAESTMDVASEEDVESRDRETQERVLVGDYQTLSLCARVCERVCFWWFYDYEHKTWRIHCKTRNIFFLCKNTK